MCRLRYGFLLWFALLIIMGAIYSVCPLHGATILGNVRGIVHDPRHLPIQGARVTISSQTSKWSQTTQSDADGTFRFDAIPIRKLRVRGSRLQVLPPCGRR